MTRQLPRRVFATLKGETARGTLLKSSAKNGYIVRFDDGSRKLCSKIEAIDPPENFDRERCRRRFGGKKIDVYWAGDQQWYSATIEDVLETGEFRIVYDDGETKRFVFLQLGHFSRPPNGNDLVWRLQGEDFDEKPLILTNKINEASSKTSLSHQDKVSDEEKTWKQACSKGKGDQRERDANDIVKAEKREANDIIEDEHQSSSEERSDDNSSFLDLSKDPGPDGNPEPFKFSELKPGVRVSVWWEDDKQWYLGKVVEITDRSGEKFHMKYDDGEEHIENFRDSKNRVKLKIIRARESTAIEEKGEETVSASLKEERKQDAHQVAPEKESERESAPPLSITKPKAVVKNPHSNAHVNTNVEQGQKRKKIPRKKPLSMAKFSATAKNVLFPHAKKHPSPAFTQSKKSARSNTKLRWPNNKRGAPPSTHKERRGGHSSDHQRPKKVPRQASKRRKPKNSAAVDGAIAADGLGRRKHFLFRLWKPWKEPLPPHVPLPLPRDPSSREPIDPRPWRRHVAH
mmetsp:Transcript_18915/g.26344  ORF Transcript_18915/g.26344 Transcript_18915/m.26344 type:complete len:516 (+) Transcript_18915:147-1694(+)